MYEVTTGKDSKKEGETILRCLEKARVISIEKREDGLFYIYELCDIYYEAGLSKEQMIVLAGEIRNIAEQ